MINHCILRSDHMSVRERILAIRLMEKLQSRPDFAKALGVEVRSEMTPTGAADKKEK
jgi:DNA-binding transcriptional regulator YiaG